MGSKVSKIKQKSKVSHKRNIPKKSVKQSSFGRLSFSLFVFVLVAVALVANVFKDFQQVVNNKKETEELNYKYDKLLEEEASLNSQVIKLQDPEYKARYARENQLYTKDGETILIIIDENKNFIKEEEK